MSRPKPSILLEYIDKKTYILSHFLANVFSLCSSNKGMDIAFLMKGFISFVSSKLDMIAKYKLNKKKQFESVNQPMKNLPMWPTS